MNRILRHQIALALLLTLVGSGSLFAQHLAPAEPTQARASSGQWNEADLSNAPDIIFSNLDNTSGTRYNSESGFIVAGKKAGNYQTESEYAVGFTPTEDVQATVLAAAITYIAGKRLVTLGIYTDDDDELGDLLPGGEGSTAEIPDSDECCQLVKVVLPGEGVALSAGTRYWLLAGADPVNGPTFQGKWHFSNRAKSGYLQPPFPWNTYQTGSWLAALIRGTKLESHRAGRAIKPPIPPDETSTSDGNVVIFNNLGPAPDPYFVVGKYSGPFIWGDDVPFEPEGWEALPFTPKADVHAKTLAAAIGYLSGTKLVNLGIYSDIGGSVGPVLPDGQASTTDIPGTNEGGALARVTLPGEGVALKAGTQYWLVASPDNVNAPDFAGQWRPSSLAFGGYQQPEHYVYWTSFISYMLAADIRGTLP